MPASAPSSASWTRELGRRIRAARQAQGLSLAAAAERAGVGLQTLLRIERGADGSAIAKVEQVLDALGLAAESPTEGARRELPRHALHLDSASVDEALEAATRAALAVLDALVATATPERDGITSRFQAQLKAHLAAMLCGQAGAARAAVLPVLAYSDAWVGGPPRAPSPENGWALVLRATGMALQDGGVLPPEHEAFEAWSSRGAALEGVRRWVERYGHLPGPVDAVPLTVDEHGRYRLLG